MGVPSDAGIKSGLNFEIVAFKLSTELSHQYGTSIIVIPSYYLKKSRSKYLHVQKLRISLYSSFAVHLKIQI